jgi:hypothetical protein
MKGIRPASRRKETRRGNEEYLYLVDWVLALDRSQITGSRSAQVLRLFGERVGFIETP